MRTYPLPRIQRWPAPAAGVAGLFLALFLALSRSRPLTPSRPTVMA